MADILENIFTNPKKRWGIRKIYNAFSESIRVRSPRMSSKKRSGVSGQQLFTSGSGGRSVIRSSATAQTNQSSDKRKL